MPDGRAAGAHIGHIQDGIGKILVKNALLNFGGKLVGHQSVHNPCAFPNRVRREPQRGGAGEGGPHYGEQQHRRDHIAAGYARGPHGHKLPIAGHTAEADQNPHHHAERDRQRQHRRNRECEQPQNGWGPRIAGDQHFEEPVHLLQEHHTGCQKRAQQ